MTHNEIVDIVLDEAFDLHRKIGPGVLESFYLHCLEYRLKKRGLKVRREVPVPLVFEEVKMDCGYRVDLIVEEMVIIEIKCVDKIIDVHLAQTLTYIKLLDFRLGVLINFRSILLKDGIRRVVNRLE